MSNSVDSCINLEDDVYNCKEYTSTGSNVYEKKLHNSEKDVPGQCTDSRGYYRLRKIHNLKQEKGLNIPGTDSDGCIDGLSVEESKM